MRVFTQYRCCGFLLFRRMSIKSLKKWTGLPAEFFHDYWML